MIKYKYELPEKSGEKGQYRKWKKKKPNSRDRTWDFEKAYEQKTRKQTNHVPTKKNRLVESIISEEEEQISPPPQQQLPILEQKISSKIHFGTPNQVQRPQQLISRLSIIKYMILNHEWIRHISRLTSTGRRRKNLQFLKRIAYLPTNQKQLKLIFSTLSHSKFFESISSQWDVRDRDIKLFALLRSLKTIIVNANSTSKLTYKYFWKRNPSINLMRAEFKDSQPTTDYRIFRNIRSFSQTETLYLVYYDRRDHLSSNNSLSLVHKLAKIKNLSIDSLVNSNFTTGIKNILQMRSLQFLKLNLIFKEQKLSKSMFTNLKKSFSQQQANNLVIISQLTINVVGNFPYLSSFGKAISCFQINKFVLAFRDYFQDHDFKESVEEMLIGFKQVPDIKIIYLMKNSFSMNEHFFYNPLGRGLSFCENLTKLCIHYGCFISQESDVLYNYLKKLKKVTHFDLVCSLESEAAKSLSELLLSWKQNLQELQISLNPFKDQFKFPPYFVTPSILEIISQSISKLEILRFLQFEIGYNRFFTKKEQKTQVSQMISKINSLRVFKFFAPGKYHSKFGLQDLIDVLNGPNNKVEEVSVVGDASNMADHHKLPLVQKLRKIKCVKHIDLYTFGVSEQSTI